MINEKEMIVVITSITPSNQLLGISKHAIHPFSCACNENIPEGMYVMLIPSMELIKNK